MRSSASAFSAAELRAVAGDHQRQPGASRPRARRRRSPSPASAGRPPARIRRSARGCAPRSRAGRSASTVAPATGAPSACRRPSANALGTTIASACVGQAPLVQRQRGGVGDRLGARAAAVEAEPGARVAAVAAGAVGAVREARADGADEPVVVQVQHDAGAGRAGGGERAPAERRVGVVRVHDAGAGAADGVADLVRVEAAGQQPARGRRVLERRPSRARAPRRPRRARSGSATRGPRRRAPRRPDGGSDGAAAGSLRREAIRGGSKLTAAMAVAASICFPTRRRREYLAVALASVAPQAAAHGAEIVVVEDDARDDGDGRARRASRRPLRRARRRARHQRRPQRGRGRVHGRARVLARRRRRRAAGLARRAAGRPQPRLAGHDAFGGPIVPRLEGARLRACGREPLPVTALDLGPDDRDAEFVWGANFAFRRAAFERIGRFDERARRRRRRGGLAAAPARRRRARPLRRGGRRRASPRRCRRAAAEPVARGVLPRPRGAPLRRA